jgi:plastocyanin
MKRIIFSQKRLLGIALVILAVFSVTNSCKKSSDSPNKGEVYIENMDFSPSTITVEQNSTVTWINKDGMDHTVTSTTGLFDSGTLSDNDTFSYTFANAGTFTYECSIHTSMVGTVIVTATPSSGGGY